MIKISTRSQGIAVLIRRKPAFSAEDTKLLILTVSSLLPPFFFPWTALGLPVWHVYLGQRRQRDQKVRVGAGERQSHYKQKDLCLRCSRFVLQGEEGNALGV